MSSWDCSANGSPVIIVSLTFFLPGVMGSHPKQAQVDVQQILKQISLQIFAILPLHSALFSGPEILAISATQTSNFFQLNWAKFLASLWTAVDKLPAGWRPFIMVGFIIYFSWRSQSWAACCPVFCPIFFIVYDSRVIPDPDISHRSGSSQGYSELTSSVSSTRILCASGCDVLERIQCHCALLCALPAWAESHHEKIANQIWGTFH